MRILCTLLGSWSYAHVTQTNVAP